MLCKAGLTSCCLPGTSWLPAICIHLQNASAELSIFDRESLTHFRGGRGEKHFRDSGFYSVVNMGIICNLLPVKERTIDVPGETFLSSYNN